MSETNNQRTIVQARVKFWEGNKYNEQPDMSRPPDDTVPYTEVEYTDESGGTHTEGHGGRVTFSGGYENPRKRHFGIEIEVIESTSDASWAVATSVTVEGDGNSYSPYPPASPLLYEDGMPEDGKKFVTDEQYEGDVTFRVF